MAGKTELKKIRKVKSGHKPKKDELFIVSVPNSIVWSKDHPMEEKFKKPSDLNGSRVKYISRVEIAKEFRSVDNPWRYTVSLPDGTVFEVAAEFLLECPEPTETHKCHCNIFITGCVCGVFQAEQKRSKYEKS